MNGFEFDDYELDPIEDLEDLDYEESEEYSRLLGIRAALKDVAKRFYELQEAIVELEEILLDIQDALGEDEDE